GEVISTEDLGGANVHATKSGVSHFLSESEEEGILLIRKLMSYLPQNNLEDPPVIPNTDPVDRLDENLNEIIPDNPNKPYNVKDVIKATVDNSDFLEVQRNYAKNIVIGFGRYNGRPAGIIANQPMFLA